IALRNIAISMGLHLNEWGLFDKKRKKICGANEREIYESLNLNYITPEMRENLGEIQFFSKNLNHPNLELIDYGELKGDLQDHTSSHVGTTSINETEIQEQ